MPAVVCLVGAASPQKTNFLESLAAAFSARGLSLGVITATAAGARGPEAVLPPGSLHLRWGNDPASEPLATLEELLARHFHGVDLVISEVEGPGRVLVEFAPAGGRSARLGEPGLKALVCAEPGETPTPCFGPDQAQALAGHLVANVLPPLDAPEAASRPKLRILVDGRRLPANAFVQEIVSGTLRAMIGSLKGGDRAGRLEIHIY